MNRRKFIAATGVTIATVVSGCTGVEESPEDSVNSDDDPTETAATGGGDDTTETPETETTTTEAPETTVETTEQAKAKIVEHDSYEKEFELGVEGKVKNVTDSTLDYLEVEVKFYDKDGNRIGDNFTNVEDLGAGKTWEFSLMFLEDGEFDSYELSATTNALS